MICGPGAILRRGLVTCWDPWCNNTECRRKETSTVSADLRKTMHLGGPRGHAGPRGGFGAQESRWAAGGGGRGVVLSRKRVLNAERKGQEKSGLLWTSVWWFLNKLSIELPYDSGILLPGIRPKELRAGVQTKTCASVFITALVTIARRWKQPRCPSREEW